MRILYGLLFVLIASISDASEVYYVSTTGNDGNTCTQARSTSTPKRNWIGASGVLSCISAGDTVFARGGTYVEAIYCGVGTNACIPAGTDWSAPVTIASYPGETAILQPSSGDRVMNFQDTGGVQHHIIVDRLVLDGTSVGFDCLQIQGTAHDIRIQNSEFKNCSGNGINIADTTSAIEILSSSIHHNGNSNLEHGIYVSGDDCIISGNHVYNNSSYGVHVFNTGGGPDRAIVSSNIVYNNGASNTAAAGIILSSGTGHLADNNYVFNNPVGIKVGSGGGTTTSAVVANNRVVDNNQAGNGLGVYIQTDSTGAIVKKNKVYGNETNYLDSGTGSSITF